MLTLREHVGKRVDNIDTTFALLRKLSESEEWPRSKEFLQIHKRFYKPNEISKAFETIEAKSTPISDAIIKERKEGEYVPTQYELRGRLYIDSTGDWFHTGTDDFSNPYGIYDIGTAPEEEINEFENGMIFVDVQYTETDSYGFLLMTGKGLKMLEYNNPNLYRVLTSLEDGNLHWKEYGEELHEITETYEYSGWGAGEDIKKVYHNYYHWEVHHTQDGMSLSREIYHPKPPGEKKHVVWISRQDIASGPLKDSEFWPLENAIRKISADHLV
tara:strand:- start:1724 stop:2539 length:816 start_codon:yes stop_codon:yes gene_type:complete